MMGHCGVWSQWGPWLAECPLCKPYGQSLVTKIRKRKCQVDGIPKNNCAGFEDDIEECDVPTCDAEYKANSQCLKTKPDDNKVCLFKLQVC